MQGRLKDALTTASKISWPPALLVGVGVITLLLTGGVGGIPFLGAILGTAASTLGLGSITAGATLGTSLILAAASAFISWVPLLAAGTAASYVVYKATDFVKSLLGADEPEIPGITLSQQPQRGMPPMEPALSPVDDLANQVDFTQGNFFFISGSFRLSVADNLGKGEQTKQYFDDFANRIVINCNDQLEKEGGALYGKVPPNISKTELLQKLSSNFIDTLIKTEGIPENQKVLVGRMLKMFCDQKIQQQQAPQPTKLTENSTIYYNAIDYKFYLITPENNRVEISTIEDLKIANQITNGMVFFCTVIGKTFAEGKNPTNKQEIKEVIDSKPELKSYLQQITELKDVTSDDLLEKAASTMLNKYNPAASSTKDHRQGDVLLNVEAQPQPQPLQ